MRAAQKGPPFATGTKFREEVREAAARPELIACVERIRNSVTYVHPAGAVWIHGWLSEMRDAAWDGDAETVARLARKVEEKVAIEQKWAAENEETAGK